MPRRSGALQEMMCRRRLFQRHAEPEHGAVGRVLGAYPENPGTHESADRLEIGIIGGEVAILRSQLGAAR